MHGHVALARRCRPQAQTGVALLRFLLQLLAHLRRIPRWPARDLLADPAHRKVLSLEAAQQMVTVREKINLRDLEQVIPFSLARGVAIHYPDSIAALNCPGHPQRADRCLPLGICSVVGEPFATMAYQRPPDQARWIIQERTTNILRSHHERAQLHYAFCKDPILGRFCAICISCARWCVAMAYWRHGTPMLASCGQVCRAGALTLIRGRTHGDPLGIRMRAGSKTDAAVDAPGSACNCATAQVGLPTRTGNTASAGPGDGSVPMHKPHGPTDDPGRWNKGAV